MPINRDVIPAKAEIHVAPMHNSEDGFLLSRE